MKKYINSGLKAITVLSVIGFPAFAKDTQKEERLSSYTKLTKALVTIENVYVDEIKFNELIDKTISGLLTNLDSHSTFMDKEKFKTFNESTNGGDFGGIGISVGMRGKLLTIIAPIDDTPGEKVGLKSGDKIVKLDDISCIDYSLEEAIGKMRGKPGTDIKITVLRLGNDEPLDFKITREIIKIKSVKAKYVQDENITYIRVSSFDKNVVELTRKELEKHPESKGVVLDLRDNPGGLLNQAIGLVDLFVDEGDILEQKGRSSENNEKFVAKKETTYSKSLPLVILVNNGSASASEIVSGALQDHKRAIIIGKQTFGKGSVQAVIPFSDGEALKVTIARYFLPSGRTIQAKGVIPDIICDAGEVLKTKAIGIRIQEKDLKNHLKIDEYMAKERLGGQTVEEVKGLLTKEDVLKDNQLNSAINTIKTINILKGN